MKNTFLLILLFTLVFSSCKAQIAPLYRIDRDNPEGTHFKDLDNDLGQFEGTWKWQSSDSIVTIVLQKKEDVHFDDTNQYEDMLLGAYKFTVNNIVIQDNLARLDDPNLTDYDHYLAGNTILHKAQHPACDDCTMNQRQVLIAYQDPLYEYINSAMVLRHKIVNGVEQMNVYFYAFNYYIRPTEASPTENRIPFGDYTFIKQ